MLTLLMLLGVAHAADAVSMSGMTTVTHGEQSPYLEFSIGEAGTLQADMQCSGQSWSLNQRVGRGDQVRLELRGISEGVHQCSGSMRMVLDRGDLMKQYAPPYDAGKKYSVNMLYGLKVFVVDNNQPMSVRYSDYWEKK